MNPVKAIRLKCLDCCCGSYAEVKECTISTCPIHPFREGKNPFRQKRVLTDEQKEAMVARLAKNRPNSSGEEKENDAQ